MSPSVPPAGTLLCDLLCPQKPGPIREARELVREELLAFLIYFSELFEARVVEMTNLEASRRPRRLKTHGQQRADLLILAGVYRSRGEACKSLWDRESGRRVFTDIMTLKRFRAYSSALCFTDQETRIRKRPGRQGGAGSDPRADARRECDLRQFLHLLRAGDQTVQQEGSGVAVLQQGGGASGAVFGKGEAGWLLHHHVGLFFQPPWHGSFLVLILFLFLCSFFRPFCEQSTGGPCFLCT